MNKNIIIGIAIVLAGAGLIFAKNQTTDKENSSIQVGTESKSVKEYSIQSFVEFVDGKPKPQFNPNEITVKKGDLVRLKITVTSGNHDFKIDEFNVFADTKLNEEKIVEFVADKAGEFVYYCTKPGHRQAGHWGKLRVLE